MAGSEWVKDFFLITINLLIKKTFNVLNWWEAGFITRKLSILIILFDEQHFIVYNVHVVI